MTNSKRSAHNHDAAAVECELLAKICNFLQQRRRQLLQCMSPLLAQSGHRDRANPCPLSGVKQTLRGRAPMSAFDPKRSLMLVTKGIAPMPKSDILISAGSGPYLGGKPWSGGNS